MRKQPHSNCHFGTEVWTDSVNERQQDRGIESDTDLSIKSRKWQQMPLSPIVTVKRLMQCIEFYLIFLSTAMINDGCFPESRKPILRALVWAEGLEHAALWAYRPATTLKCLQRCLYGSLTDSPLSKFTWATWYSHTVNLKGCVVGQSLEGKRGVGRGTSLVFIVFHEEAWLFYLNSCSFASLHSIHRWPLWHVCRNKTLRETRQL